MSEKTKAPLVNRYKNPRAFFSTDHDAFSAALAVNDATDSYCCYYRKLEGCYEVVAEGVELPRFIKLLKQAGCRPL